MPAAHVNAYDCAPPVARRMHRRAVATAVVAGVYVMMALAAPWLVRYGAEFTPAVAAATQPGAANLAPRCATAPEYGRACPDEDGWLD